MDSEIRYRETSVQGISTFFILLFTYSRKFEVLALYVSSVLMVLFTLYILTVFHLAKSVPCTCGEIIPSLSWKEHLLFNLGCLVTALIRSKQAGQTDRLNEQNSKKRLKNILLQQKQGKLKT